MWMNIPLGLVLTVAGTLCHKITLDALQKVSPCTTGLRAGIDRFFINGTVTGADNLEMVWDNAVNIQAVRKTGQLWYPCHVSLTTHDCNYPDRTENCYCNDKNSATGEAHFVANLIARVILSEAVFRALLIYTNSTLTIHSTNNTLYSSNNVTLPKMYDLQEAQLNLTVYGVMGNLSIPGSCNFSLTLNRSNHLRLCCFNTPTPCHPRISFGADVVSGSSCVSYPTSPLTSDGVTRDLVLSFSVCNQVENILGRNCNVTTTPDVFVPATESPGTIGTPGTTGSPATATRTRTGTRTPITSTSNENPSPTTMPFLWTTDMIFKRADDKNVLTTFGPGLLIAVISFIVAFLYVFWVSREASIDNKPFNNHPEAGDAVGEKDSDKHSEAVDAAEEKDDDTLKQEENSTKVSTLQLW